MPGPATPQGRSLVECIYFETQRWIISKLFVWRGDEVEQAKFEEFYDEKNAQVILMDG